MNSFVKGMLLGVGIGLIVAPMKGEEMRRLLRERFEELRANLPMQSTASDLRGLAQQAGSEVKQTGQDVAGATKQAATKAGQSA